jgi:hypothetical protein
MLKNICNRHPAIVISNEFHAFSRISGTVDNYRKGLRINWYKRPIVGRGHKLRLLDKIESAAFIVIYLSYFLGRGRQPISLVMIEQAYRRIFPRAALIGDKYPRYVFNLKDLVGYPDMKRVMIFRDPRDVVSSVIQKTENEWKGLRFAGRFDSAEKAARSWVHAMENIQQFHSQILPIKYEDLVYEPDGVLSRLSEYLAVDRAGFVSEIVKTDRVGKYRHGLPSEDICTVEKVAGKWMEEYGYL